MKKSLFLALSTFVFLTLAAQAEEEAIPESAAAAVDASMAAAQSPVAEPAAENLEFVSGEVTAVDAAAKSLTIKLYGEGETEQAEKTLTVSVDENTDITDGEKERELSTLTASTEVDVEYDPATSQATYIFVY